MHGAAAQHADLDGVIEQHQIERGFERRGGAIVLGIEEFGVAQGDVTDLALALGGRFAEIGEAALAEFGDPLQRFALGSEHGVNEMHAAAFVGEDLPEEQALIELAAFLGALLLQGPLSLDLLAGRQQRRIAARHCHQQFANPQKTLAAAGHLVVKRDSVTPEELFLDVQRLSLKRRRFASLSGLHERFDFSEIFAGGLGIARKRRAKNRFSGRRRRRADGDCLQRNLPWGARWTRHLASNIARFAPPRHRQK